MTGSEIFITHADCLLKHDRRVQCGYCDAIRELAIMQKEIDRLKEELEDANGAYRDVMNEICAGDEVHCTCVPHLRRGIAELKSANTKLLNGLRLGLELSKYVAAINWSEHETNTMEYLDELATRNSSFQVIAQDLLK